MDQTTSTNKTHSSFWPIDDWPSLALSILSTFCVFDVLQGSTNQVLVKEKNKNQRFTETELFVAHWSSLARPTPVYASKSLSLSLLRSYQISLNFLLFSLFLLFLALFVALCRSLSCLSQARARALSAATLPALCTRTHKIPTYTHTYARTINFIAQVQLPDLNNS